MTWHKEGDCADCLREQGIEVEDDQYREGTFVYPMPCPECLELDVLTEKYHRNPHKQAAGYLCKAHETRALKAKWRGKWFGDADGEKVDALKGTGKGKGKEHPNPPAHLLRTVNFT